MNAARWKYLKNLKPASPRMVHESCIAFMAPDPRSAIVGFELPRIPTIVPTGGTYNVGRNKAKREKRALAKAERAAIVKERPLHAKAFRELVEQWKKAA